MHVCTRKKERKKQKYIFSNPLEYPYNLYNLDVFNTKKKVNS